MIAVSAPAPGRVADRAASGVARWAQARQLAPVSVAAFSVGFAIIAGAWLTGSSGRDCAIGLAFLLACVLTARVARGGMQVGDIAAPDGALVLLLLAAAGRDPEVFENPDVFDIKRGATAHLAFAAGPHFCLGAPLARLEASIALQEFARRVVAPELDPRGLAYKPNLNLRGPESLVVNFASIS